MAVRLRALSGLCIGKSLFLLLRALRHDLFVALRANFAFVLDSGQGAKGRARPGMLPVETIFQRIQISHRLP